MVKKWALVSTLKASCVVRAALFHCTCHRHQPLKAGSQGAQCCNWKFRAAVRT